LRQRIRQSVVSHDSIKQTWRHANRKSASNKWRTRLSSNIGGKL
jgi:hypothetical protein